MLLVTSVNGNQIVRLFHMDVEKIMLVVTRKCPTCKGRVTVQMNVFDKDFDHGKYKVLMLAAIVRTFPGLFYTPKRKRRVISNSI